MPKKLLQKYNVIQIDNEGWMVCEPRPDNSVNCVEITEKLQDSIDKVDLWISKEEFFIVGQWGETIALPDNKSVDIQRADKIGRAHV